MFVRILLIEDNPGDSIIFREKLSDGDLDYELVHATRLSEGLDLLAEESFDIVFCDLSLPDASGVDAVVRVHRAAPGVPLMVLTGLDDASTATQARNEGAIDYLVKWYQDGTALARYIRYALADQRGREALPDVEEEENASVVEQAAASTDAVRPHASGPPAAAPTQPVSTSKGRPSSQAPMERQPSTASSRDRSESTLFSAAQAALQFAQQTERRSRWMVEVLSATIELEQHARRGVEPQMGLVNLTERLNHAMREHRPLAMERGVPLRTSADRDKVMALADRHLVDMLMRRLIVDALLTTKGGYVRVSVRVAGQISEIEVTWPSADEEWVASAPVARSLSQAVVTQVVSRMEGRCSFEPDGPLERVLVRLAGRAGVEV